MPKENPKKFDAKFVLSAIGKVGPVTSEIRSIREGWPLYHYDEEQGELLPIDKVFKDLLSFFGRKHFAESQEDPLVRHWLMLAQKKEGDRWLKEASRINPELCEIIKDGRIQMLMIIDSKGGLAVGAESMIMQNEFIKSNNGQVVAFGGKNISSAAAILFMSANKTYRFMYLDSTLFFHLPSTCWAEEHMDDPEFSDKKEEEKEKLRKLLLSEVIKGRRKEMNAIIDNAFDNPAPDEPDCPIVLNSEQAQYFGLAKIRKHLLGEFQRLAQFRTQNEKVRGFFLKDLLGKFRESL